MSLRVHTSTKMTKRLLEAQQSDKKVTTVTGSVTRAWNGDLSTVRRVNALQAPLAAAFQAAQVESVARPSNDEVGQVTDINQIGDLADYSDEEGDARALVERLNTEDNTMDQERTYQLPAREADDANPELLANEEPASFILSSEDKTLGRFVEAAFAPIGLVSTRVEGDKNGTPAVTDGDHGYIMMQQLLKSCWATSLLVPVETNTSTVATERFDGAVPVMLSQRGSVSSKGPSTCRHASRLQNSPIDLAQVARRYQALPRRICYGDPQTLGRRHEARAGPLGAHGVRVQPAL